MALDLKNLFRKKDYTSPVDARPMPVPPDPQAFAPIPAPAPYRPVYSFPADLPPGRTFIEESWPNRIGREEYIPPVRQQRYAGDTEYRRDLDTTFQDGIGSTDDVYTTAAPQQFERDVRELGVNPNLGKRPMRMVDNQPHFTYYRHFEGWMARRLDGSHGSVADIIRTPTPQGNYAVRTWRLTDRQDPLDSDPRDVTTGTNGISNDVYTGNSGIRRSFRI